MKRSAKRKTGLLNTLGSIGYFVCLVQWLWTIMILLPSMLDSPAFKLLAPNSDSESVQPVLQSAAPATLPAFVSIAAFVVGVLIIIGMLYVIVMKFPRSVAKTGEKMTHTVASVITPIVVERMHVPPKQRQQVPASIIIGMKLLLVLTPPCLLLFARELDLAMSFESIMSIGIWLFSWSLLLFTGQYILSRFMKVSYKTIR